MRGLPIAALATNRPREVGHPVNVGVSTSQIFMKRLPKNIVDATLVMLATYIYVELPRGPVRIGPLACFRDAVLLR
jgi:hypothetical protein